MKFYADVPDHQWLMIGSQARQTATPKSDFDVVLRGVSRADLEHPYFSDLLARLRPHDAAGCGVLDLFLDMPERHRLENVFHPELAIDAGEQVYQRAFEGSIPMTPQHFMRALAFFAQRGRVF